MYLKKIRVYIDLETEKVTKRCHPAFGIWADRLSEVDSGEVAKKLRKKLESIYGKISKERLETHE